MKEKLKAMYQSGAIDMNGLLKAVERGWVTMEDVIEIVGEDNSLAIIRAAKIAEISKSCNAIIVAGIDLELTQGAVHFNLSIEDQANIANLFRVVELGGTEFPYQSDGGVCRIYTAAEIAQIYIAAQTLITTQTTYHNCYWHCVYRWRRYGCPALAQPVHRQEVRADSWMASAGCSWR